MEHAEMENSTLRIATADDAAKLLEIYSYYVLNTAITFEYEVPTEEEFARRIRNTLQRYPYLVAQAGGLIMGYAYAGPFKERAAYQWSVETSIYVHKDYRHLGIGALLYRELEKILKEQNILNVNACIACPAREQDPYLTKDSISFHEKQGYRLVGEFRQCGYKFNRWYNMVWMEKFIGEHTDNQPRVIPFCEWRG